jgi:hypothetical protein
MVAFTGCCVAHLALEIWYLRITVSAMTSDMQCNRKPAFEFVEITAKLDPCSTDNRTPVSIGIVI